MIDIDKFETVTAVAFHPSSAGKLRNHQKSEIGEKRKDVTTTTGESYGWLIKFLA